jgi:hypothetical protein
VIGQGLYQVLAANCGGDAIDTYVAGRIFYDAAPPDLSQLPCIAFNMIGGSSEPTFDTSGMIAHRVEINGLAVMPDTENNLQPSEIAGAIREAIIQRLNGWQQHLSDGTDVSMTELVNPGTDFVTEQRVFRAMCEFRFHYTLPPA